MWVKPTKFPLANIKRLTQPWPVWILQGASQSDFPTILNCFISLLFDFDTITLKDRFVGLQLHHPGSYISQRLWSDSLKINDRAGPHHFLIISHPSFQLENQGFFSTKGKGWIKQPEIRSPRSEASGLQASKISENSSGLSAITFYFASTWLSKYSKVHSRKNSTYRAEN